MKRVAIVARRRRRGIRAGDVRRDAERLLDLLDLDAELSVALVDDAEIHRLNKQYRHVDRPTDVLAFAMREGDGGVLHPDLLGDVVISLDTAARQAAAREAPLADEVRRTSNRNRRRSASPMDRLPDRLPGFHNSTLPEPFAIAGVVRTSTCLSCAGRRMIAVGRRGRRGTSDRDSSEPTGARVRLGE